MTRNLIEKAAAIDKKRSRKWFQAEKHLTGRNVRANKIYCNNAICIM